MGNQSCCSTRQRNKAEILDKNDQLTLNEIFKYYANQQQETYGQLYLTRESIQRMFSDSQHFAQNLYDYCANQCNQRFIPFQLMSDIICSFIRTVENIYTEFTQLQQLTLFMIGKFHLRNMEDKQVLQQLQTISINTTQGFQIFMFILQMFSICTTKRMCSFQNKTLEALIQGIFGSLNLIGSQRFIEAIELYFPIVQQLIKSYFAMKFLQRPCNGIKAPRMSEESKIISKDHVVIMSLASPELHRFDQMNLNFNQYGINFYNFMNLLLQSGQNNLILLEFESQKTTFVYAIYNQQEWFTDINEQEFTDGHVIFQLKPQVHVYTAKQLKQKNFRQSSPVNYVYIIDGAVNQDHIGFGLAKDSLSSAFMIWLGPFENYITYEGQQISATLKNSEIWVLTTSPYNALELVKERNSYIARSSLNRKSALQLQRATQNLNNQYETQTEDFLKKSSQIPDISQSQQTQITEFKGIEMSYKNQDILQYQPMDTSFKPQQVNLKTEINQANYSSDIFHGIDSPRFQRKFNPQYQFDNPIRSTSSNLIDERKIEGRKSQAIIDKYKNPANRPSSITPRYQSITIQQLMEKSFLKQTAKAILIDLFRLLLIKNAFKLCNSNILLQLSNLKFLIIDIKMINQHARKLISKQLEKLPNERYNEYYHKEIPKPQFRINQKIKTPSPVQKTIEKTSSSSPLPKVPDRSSMKLQQTRFFQNSFLNSINDDSSERITNQSCFTPRIRNPYIQEPPTLVTKRKNIVPNIVLPKNNPLESTKSIKMSFRPSKKVLDPIRMKVKFIAQTQAGQLKNGYKKINQDSTIIMDSFLGNNYLFGICDGHGQFGHLVSEFVCHSVPYQLQKNLSLTDTFSATVHRAITSTFRQTQRQLEGSTQLDAYLSGTTANFLAIIDNTLYCASVGDSRCVAAYLTDQNQWGYREMSQGKDHKPDIQEERDRIINLKGRVHRQKLQTGQEIGPLRVWAPEHDYPGLAMTRSLGDNLSKEFGVVCDPQISELPIDNTLKFIIIASDGIWEMINSNEAIDIIKDYYSSGTINEGIIKLIEISKFRWLEQEESIDDISVLVIYF